MTIFHSSTQVYFVQTLYIYIMYIVARLKFFSMLYLYFVEYTVDSIRNFVKKHTAQSRYLELYMYF